MKKLCMLAVVGIIGSAVLASEGCCSMFEQNKNTEGLEQKINRIGIFESLQKISGEDKDTIIWALKETETGITSFWNRVCEKKDDAIRLRTTPPVKIEVIEKYNATRSTNTFLKEFQEQSNFIVDHLAVVGNRLDIYGIGEEFFEGMDALIGVGHSTPSTFKPKVHSVTKILSDVEILSKKKTLILNNLLSESLKPENKCVADLLAIKLLLSTVSSYLEIAERPLGTNVNSTLRRFPDETRLVDKYQMPYKAVEERCALNESRIKAEKAEQENQHLKKEKEEIARKAEEEKKALIKENEDLKSETRRIEQEKRKDAEEKAALQKRIKEMEDRERRSEAERKAKESDDEDRIRALEEKLEKMEVKIKGLEFECRKAEIEGGEENEALLTNFDKLSSVADHAARENLRLRHETAEQQESIFILTQMANTEINRNRTSVKERKEREEKERKKEKDKK